MQRFSFVNLCLKDQKHNFQTKTYFNQEIGVRIRNSQKKELICRAKTIDDRRMQPMKFCYRKPLPNAQ